MDLTEQGSNVVATGSGSIDLAGLRLNTSQFITSLIRPQIAYMIAGPSAFVDWYGIGSDHPFTGPTNFGSGGDTVASSGSGDLVGIQNNSAALGNLLFVPAGYVSGSPLSDTATYDNRNFSTLGVTPGTYEWTWGSGANQNFTLVVGTVPEPSTWAMMLLGFAGLGYAGYRRREALVRV